MCGRFTLTADPEQLRAMIPGLSVPEGSVRPRYNVAPSQPVAVIPNDGKNQLDFFVWGLIPSWAKETKPGDKRRLSALINARGETVDEKPSFRTAFRRRRCLIPANGFYEWKQEQGQKRKTPMYIRLKSGQPFTFAGLWERWQSSDGSMILSCAIITTQPNTLLRDIHNRMPVILPHETYSLWLDPGEQDPKQLKAILRPYPAEEMIAYPVSTLVNSPANDSAECILPVGQ